LLAPIVPYSSEVQQPHARYGHREQSSTHELRCADTTRAGARQWFASRGSV